MNRPPSKKSRHTAEIDRRQTARKFLQGEIEKLPADGRAVIERFINRGQVSRNIALEFAAGLTFGERLSDKVAAVGGSWTFILSFLLALVVWIAFNSFVLAREAFDPYPYILLNLVLSCVAAIQEPIIMMSQNRQGAADRLGARHDYEVNVKSELEVMQLHEKIDELRERDWTKLVELQNHQIGLLQQVIEQQSAASRGIKNERGQS